MTRQADFAAALLDPAAAVPRGLAGPGGGPAGRRFAVYRNNVAVGLTEALETGVPVVRRLVGDEFFRAMAGVFLRAHPPREPRLMLYGAEFPGFVAGFAPARGLPYLACVARLEQALRESYHAADAAPVDAARMAAAPPDALAQARLGLAPAVRLVRSDWPVLGIWRANTEPGAPRPGRAAEDVLVARPGFDPRPVGLGPGEAAFAAALSRLLGAGAIAALHLPEGDPA